jgi:hypothetical protein
MKLIIFSVIGQILKEGRTFQLFFLLLVGALAYVSYYLAKKDKIWMIRPLEALEAIYEGIGRSAEMGRPAMILPGISNLGNPQTLAGLTVLGEVTQRSAEIGADIITCSQQTDVIVASQAIVRSSYSAVGKQDLYSPGKQVVWFGGDQFSYAVGASGQIIAHKPALVVYLGYFLWDVIVTAETGNRMGAITIGGTLGDLPMMAMFCDHILIGEEMYAAASAITRDKFSIATLASQDWVKIVMISLMLLGGLLVMAGVPVLPNLLGM